MIMWLLAVGLSVSPRPATETSLSGKIDSAGGKEVGFSRHQTCHNSRVIHAGFIMLSVV